MKYNNTVELIVDVDVFHVGLKTFKILNYKKQETTEIIIHFHLLKLFFTNQN